MSTLRFKASQFIFIDKNGERLLLDCSDFLSNKSSVSMHRLPGQEFTTIPDLILDLYAKEEDLPELYRFQTYLLDVLLARQLIRSPKPVRMLEYGSLDGRVSYHLAAMLGTFNEESLLVCAYDAIEPEWQERIADVDKPPRLAYYAGDFGSIELKERSFDMILLNGITNFERPELVLQDAIKLLRPDGVMIALVNDTPFLESAFKLHFETRDEYEIIPTHSILMAQAADYLT